jgi:hypothetical protein
LQKHQKQGREVVMRRWVDYPYPNQGLDHPLSIRRKGKNNNPIGSAIHAMFGRGILLVSREAVEPEQVGWSNQPEQPEPRQLAARRQ